MSEQSSKRPENKTAEPVAVIGIGCRFPRADGPDAFWRSLVDGVDAIGEIPTSRFPVELLYDARPATHGRISTRFGGFLENVESFDAEFFGISPREAAWLDPQQRLLLETTWEALESAGQIPARLRGSNTAVYVGMWLNEYEARMFRDPALIEFYMTTGTGRYAASGRISNVFDWRGPSMTLDCACSSSLVAVHLACRSLRSGECDLAVAGGANVLLEPSITLAYSQSRMMAPDGRCKFGDARADGYVRSDGAGVVVLKRLSCALADGDPIVSIILGSAVNNDGGSGGSFGTPGKDGQIALLRSACRDAGISPTEVDYVEAHGTGTRAGDPVEIAAIASALGEGRSATRPLVIGSVKTNIGHTESAAGVAGLIKASLALKHNAIPGNLHFETPNPDIPWRQLPVEIPRSTRPWPDTGRPGIAGVSSFGISGTNAHIVLRRCGAEETQTAGDTASIERKEIVTLSARSREALRAMAACWEEWAANRNAAAQVADLAFTTALRREHDEYRLAVVAEDIQQLRERLKSYSSGEPSKGIAEGKREGAAPPKVVFVCPGQGSQWLGMGRGLYKQEKVFRETFDRCDAAIAQVTNWSLVEMILGGSDEWFGDIAMIQPALFAIQVALADLWRSWGVEPAAVVGHSMGEVAAACICGVLELDEAVRVICNRSRLMKRTSGKGAMALVELSLTDARRAIVGYESAVSVAVSNSNRSSVLSGEPQAITEILFDLEQKGIFCRLIKVDVASHSPQMDPIRGELVESLSRLEGRAAVIPMISTVTGDFVRGDELDANYWGRNLREPVLFASALDRLARGGHTLFVELSPHPVLTSAIQQQAGNDTTEIAWPSLRREEDDRFVMLETLCGLYCAGVEPDWNVFFPTKRSFVSLPSYPWQRERHWYESSASSIQYGNEPAEKAACGELAASGNVTETGSLYYEIAWKAIEDTRRPKAAALNRHFLVFVDDQGIGSALAADLTRQGNLVTTVGRAKAFLRSGPNAFQIEAGNHEHIDRLFDEGRCDTASAWTDVVFCWNVDGCEDLNAAYVNGPESMIGLLKTICRASDTRPRMWIVSAGAQAVIDSDRVAHPSMGMLWGFGRVVANEHPQLHCTNVDYPAASSDSDRCALRSILLGDESENQLAIREGKVFAPRLVSKHHNDAEPSMLGARRVIEGATFPKGRVREGTYLVTGGAGGLGLLTAQWLLEHGATTLVLVNRRRPGPEAEEKIEVLRRSGATVWVRQVDVTDRDAVAALLAEIDANAPRLAGIVHAAGVLDDCTLLEMTKEHFRRATAVKVEGSWNLHELTRTRSLDLFLMFSSVAPLLGLAGQANYAAGNAFLDALAVHRRGLGLAGTAIAWGPWADIGLAAADTKRGQRLAILGLPSLTPKEGVAALNEFLREPYCYSAVFHLDWLRFKDGFPDTAAWPIFGDLSLAQKSTKLTSNTDTIRQAALKMDAGRPRMMFLQSEIRAVVARVLRQSVSKIDPNKAFRLLGLDSLMGIELRNQLERGFGTPLPATLIWNYPTVSSLSEEIARRAGLAAAENAGHPTESDKSPHQSESVGEVDEKSMEAILDELERMSDEETREALKREAARGGSNE